MPERITCLLPRSGYHRRQPSNVARANPLGGEPQAHGTCEPSGVVEDGGTDGPDVLVAFTESGIKPLFPRYSRLLPDCHHGVSGLKPSRACSSKASRTYRQAVSPVSSRSCCRTGFTSQTSSSPNVPGGSPADQIDAYPVPVAVAVPEPSRNMFWTSRWQVLDGSPAFRMICRSVGSGSSTEKQSRISVTLCRTNKGEAPKPTRAPKKSSQTQPKATDNPRRSPAAQALWSAPLPPSHEEV